MDASLLAAAIGLLGVALGWGVTGLGALLARRRAVASTLSALVAEVEGINRLVRHRGYRDELVAIADEARVLIENGTPNAAASMLQFSVKNEYFTIYKALVSQIGLLKPYQADRIVRFYMLANAASENYQPDSIFREGVTALSALELAQNDLQLFDVMHALGREISGFRRAKAPKGIISLPDPPAPSILPFIAVPTANLVRGLAEQDAIGEEMARQELTRRGVKLDEAGVAPIR